MILALRGLLYHIAIDGSPGSEPTVVLLHGFGGSAEDWRGIMASLRGEGLASVAVDLPGHGQTGVPDDPARFTLAETVTDLAAIMLMLGLERAHWLGYSMGGRVALGFAIREPRLVESLILESAAPGIPDPEARRLRRDQDEELATRILGEGVDWFVRFWEAQPIFSTQKRLSADLREALSERRRGNAAAGLAGSLRGIGQGVQEDLTPRLGVIACPTLLVTGTEDHKYAAIAESMAAMIPAAVHVSIPGSGHAAHLEQPEAFCRAISQHIERIARGDRESPAHRTTKASR